MLHLGDNLVVMRDMESESVDLIYADPPFGTGKDWREYRDKWGGLSGYLDFMQPRLEEMWRLLQPAGQMYLHCDQKSSHYLKVAMDGIFGMPNFRSEIIWRIGWVSGFKTQKNGWIRNHDTILHYIKTQAGKKRFNKEYIPYPEGYTRIDGSPATGKGFPVEDTWNCHPRDSLHSINVQRRKTTSYKNQKPIKLMNRIIKASSNEGDLVLDPFCGSGTTLVAAKALKRLYIGIDELPRAIEISRQRLGE